MAYAGHNLWAWATLFIVTFAWAMVFAQNGTNSPLLPLPGQPGCQVFSNFNDSSSLPDDNGTILIKVGHLFSPEEGDVLNLVTMLQAEMKLRKDGLISDRIRFQYYLCTVASGTTHQEGRGIELRIKYDIDVLIGPRSSNSMIPIGTMAIYWDLPMFGYFSTYTAFADKSVYQTLVRVCPTLDQMSEVIKLLCKEFNWSRLAVLYNVNDTLVTGSILPVLEDDSSGLRIVCQMELNQVGNDSNLYRKSLECIRKKARIVFIYLSNNPAVHRDFMLMAYDMGMTQTGEFVYIMPNGFKDKTDRKRPWIQISGIADGRNDDAKEAFESAIFLDVEGSELPAHQKADREIKAIAAKPPFNFNQTIPGADTTSFAQTCRINLYNTMYLYGKAVNTCMKADPKSYRSGTRILKCSAVQSFEGYTGETVFMNTNSERKVVYLIQTYDRDTNNLTTNLIQDLHDDHECDVLRAAKADNSTSSVQAHVHDCSQKLLTLNPFTWKTASGKLPPDSPACGFEGEKCLSSTLSKCLPPALICSFVLLALVAIAVYRRYRKAKFADIANLSWRIQPSQLLPVNKMRRLHGSFISHGSKDKGIAQSQVFSDNSRSQLSNASPCQDEDAEQRNAAAAPLALYGKTVVHLARFRRAKSTSFDFKFQHLRIFKEILDIRHENLNELIGVSVFDAPPEIAIVWHHGAKGSLEAIIGNTDIELDFAFKSSIMRDVVNGLDFLHNRSTVGYHGHLRSDNCLVSSRWVVQLSDYGMPKLLGDFFNSGTLVADDTYSVATNWKEQDIADFAVILYEVITRSSYPDDSFRAIEHLFTIEKTQSFLHEKSIFNHNAELIKLFQQCQGADAAGRPTIAAVRQAIFKHSHGVKNLVDHMMSIMEKYASNLEGLVTERTALLQDERKRADHLLYQLLPRSVADNLKQGLPIVPECYDQTSVYFNDIVGFTTICSESSPIEVVDMLNKLYQSFDGIIGLHDCYKVETIGDAYLVVSGVPKRNGQRHATEIADMALKILCFVKNEFAIPHQPSSKVQIRIGIHSGPLAAGVIGLSMPKYCLFGDTVNVASRMESNGEAGKIQISWTTKAMLAGKAKYKITQKGEIQIKGKGMCETFWLEKNSRE